MGEYENSIQTLEFATKFLPELIGTNYFQKAIDIFEKFQEYDYIIYRLCHLYFQLDQFEKSKELVEKLFKLIENAQSKHNEHLKNSLFLLQCKILEKQGNRAKAIQDLYNVIFRLEQKTEKEQVKIQKKNIQFDKKKRQLQLAHYYDTLSEMYWMNGFVKLAQNYQKRSLIVKKEILPQIHPDVAITQRFLYRILHYRDKNEEKQEEYFEKSQKSISSIRAFFYISINEQEKLKESINMSLKNANELFRNRKVYQNSLSPLAKKDLSFDHIFRKSCFFRSFEFTRRICSEESTEFQEEALRMTQICYELGQLKEGAFYLNKLHNQLIQHINEDSRLMRPLYYEQCQLQFELQNYQESLSLNEKLLALFTEAEKISLDYCDVLGQKVAILTNMNRIDEAIRTKEQTQRIRIRILGPQHQSVISGEQLISTILKLKK